MFLLMYSEKSTLNWYATAETVEELQSEFDDLKARLPDEEMVVIVPVVQAYQRIDGDDI